MIVDRHRHRPPARRSMHVFEVLVFAAFVSIVGFCAYDGFKEIFTRPPDFKPKQAEDSIAELKASIAKSKDLAGTHKYVKAGRGERRSALSTDPPPPPPAQVFVLEPVLHEEEPPAFAKVIMVSAMQEAPCVTDGGDKLHYLSVLNKQDYARLHGYDFILGIKQVDSQLENMWNKPAWLLKVLEDEERQGEWILWVDIDTVIIDANFTLPYDDFAAKSKDLVVYGNLTQVKAGHPVQGLNTGVMLVRNTPWARHFFSEVNRLGRLDDHHRGKTTLSSLLLKELQAGPYSDGLRDQNAVIYLLKTHPEWQDRVAFLDKEVCLNCYWRDLIGVTGFAQPDFERTENVSFVQHFMGCQTCNAMNRNGDLGSCRDGMFHSFKFVKEYQHPMLLGARPRSEADFAQLRELPFCSNNPATEGCKGAKPLNGSIYTAASPAYDWSKVDNAVVTYNLKTEPKSAVSQQGSAVKGPDSEQTEDTIEHLGAGDTQLTGQAQPKTQALESQVASSRSTALSQVEEGSLNDLREALREADQQLGGEDTVLARIERDTVERREARAVIGSTARRPKHRKHARLGQDSQKFDPEGV